MYYLPKDITVQEYQLIEHKVVVITSTEVERNVVTLSTSQISDPKYRVGMLLEIAKNGPEPWYVNIMTLLLMDKLIYSLTDRNLPSSDDQQEFNFSLLDELLPPQLEKIIEEALLDI